MSDHIWKIGDWCHFGGNRCLVVNTTEDDLIYVNSEMSIVYQNAKSLATYLPDCDSWNLPLQLREGAWYERRDGEIVGPLKKLDCLPFEFAVVVDEISKDSWRRNGRYNAHDTISNLDLIREVPAPAPPIEPPEGYRLLSGDDVIADGDFYLSKNGCWYDSTSIGALVKSQIAPNNARAYARKIVPKYRPFANAEEFEPHRDRWYRRKDLKNIIKTSEYGESHIDGWTYQNAFIRLEFENGEPFGVREQ